MITMPQSGICLMAEMGEFSEEKRSSLKVWADSPQLFDRWASNQAQNNTKNANANESSFAANAAQDRNSILPTLKNEVNNPTGYTADQQHQALTAGEAGAGGATSSLEGRAGLESMRTRNSGASGGVLDALARGKAAAAAKTSEGIANASNELGQKKQAGALSDLSGLYGTDTGNQLKSAAQSTEDINAKVNADKTGWFQNMTSLMDSGAKDAESAAALKTAF